MLGDNVFDFRIKPFESILDNAFFPLSELQKHVYEFLQFCLWYLMIGQVYAVDGTVLDNSAPAIDIRTFVINNRALEASNNAFIELLNDPINFSFLQSVD